MPAMPLPAALLAILMGAVATGLLAGAAPLGSDAYPTTDSDSLAPLSAVAQIGKRLFFDPALSGSGTMSCASCHDPANAYAPANALAVQLGGPALDLPGIRAVPSLTYRIGTPPFTIGPALDEDGDAMVPGLLAAAPSTQGKAANTGPDLVPQGGLFWDGRADTFQEQPLGPLLSPFEMANASPEALAATLRTRPYAPTLAALFGERVMTDPEFMIAEASYALARYQIEEPSFHAFTSKYDFYLAGEATLTPEEALGLKLFKDPKKGNCAACHLSRPDAQGKPPLFTDFEYEALGAPRNPKIPANADSHYFDLGICGPLRADRFAGADGNCGLFKTPSLRNVATRHVFFHNGVFTSLEDVLHFYVERDTNPEKFYPESADGTVAKYDDLPRRYRANVDTIDAPLDRHPGDRPALDDAEIDAVVAFLKTLTDGYSPAAGD